MQTHKFHQHLIGIGRAVKGTGAWPVIAGHLSCHQLVAANFAVSKLISHLGFFVIR